MTSATVEAEPVLEQEFSTGDTAWFEYHCWENDESADAQLWYRSHQKVTVLSFDPADGRGFTRQERGEIGQPFCYTVRFEDGHEGCAVEDELSASQDAWFRPDPPRDVVLT